ncbi:hypothetical protein N1030_10940 [Desulfovibrio mangrovi]|uniref:hypothetical protein n=1 Tax=Desulfovibrio mangrovi TaxID=2976983 RepID=UPI0022463982|nr:hypothetical protein [Desulfovibrio mangrovi]UZP66139.1 hypothetical protein N1030_10940 [Desulfovibrio mangrovi]
MIKKDSYPMQCYRHAVACLTLLAALLTLGGCMGGNSNGVVADDDSATFTVQGTTAVMRGMIDRSTASAIIELMTENDQVRTISMQRVTSSAGYRELRDAARLLRDYRLTTHVPADGYISQDALDFYIGGWKRTAAQGATIAVGSWFDGDNYGVDLPRHNSLHYGYLTWFRENGLPEDFYWFSLNAAPKGNERPLTREEMVRYRVVTE